jgi:dipeptidyl aminopeptidase/acylaminoacyl peptidase
VSPAKQVAPYGAWLSPITAESLARGGVRLGEVRVSGADLYWLEGRPTEGGRNVVVRRAPDGAIGDVTPQGYDVRTLVHEYGGGAYSVHDDAVFFASFEDQRIHRQDAGGQPRPITPEPPRPRALRYADLELSPDGRCIYCVRETHPESGEAVNEIVALPSDGSGEPTLLVGGHDFVSYPRLSPDATRLCWTSWEHPRMPWDGTELWLADLTADGKLGEPRCVAGGPSESIYQPAFAPDGTLHFVSDRSGWWNLYRLGEDGPEALAPMEAEFGRPQWGFAGATYGFLRDGRVCCVFGDNGSDHLGTVESGRVREIQTPYAAFGRVAPFARGGRDALALIAASPSQSPAVVILDPADGRSEVVRLSREDAIPHEQLSSPESVEFPTAGDRTAHALYYAPRSSEFCGPEGERPPLVVMSHGGPTGATSSTLNPAIQFWTTRGFAVVDVNYGGSTGYGRAYRERLRGSWGVVDTQDCIAAALWLAERGLVDRERMAIRGGSAGGYTTLCALTFHDVFAAGASYYGVADAEALARDTHKFESRYLDSLIGPYPEARELYRERSPIHFAERLSCPLLLLQGLEDAIVPPAQAEVMVAALRARGLPWAYLAFEGEQHGFRRAENMIRAQQAELYFYSRVFGFEAADALEPIEIENL